MPVRAVCKPHSLTSKRGALATDARGCSMNVFLRHNDLHTYGKICESVHKIASAREAL